MSLTGRKLPFLNQPKAMSGPRLSRRSANSGARRTPIGRKSRPECAMELRNPKKLRPPSAARNPKRGQGFRRAASPPAMHAACRGRTETAIRRRHRRPRDAAHPRPAADDGGWAADFHRRSMNGGGADDGDFRGRSSHQKRAGGGASPALSRPPPAPLDAGSRAAPAFPPHAVSADADAGHGIPYALSRAVHRPATADGCTPVLVRAGSVPPVRSRR